MNRYRKAFTLIELLVVVSIISLLVSILLPALSKAREAGKQAVCSSNLRTLGTLNQVYLTEHDGVWVPGFTTQQYGMWYVSNGTTHAGFYISWMDLIGGATFPKLFDCPSIKQQEANDYILSLMPPDYPYDYPVELNYIYNTYLFWVLEGAPKSRRFDGVMRRPADFACFMDGRAVGQGYAYACSWDIRVGNLAFPHNNRSNVAFCDGHVEICESLDLEKDEVWIWLED